MCDWSRKIVNSWFWGKWCNIRSLFCNGDKLPSENKKLVSRGLVGSRKCGGGGKSSSSSSTFLLFDLWGGVWGGVSGKLKFMLDFLLLIIPFGMFESSLSLSLICLFWNLSWFCRAIILEFWAGVLSGETSGVFPKNI